ncbi:type II secretion system major pseudopilin GspG [bacterium]|nr:type II secretion system major pseudopilin GspG [bacterium]MBU1613853.1 type II secretion system major pseudopilin GspG [bacterium]
MKNERGFTLIELMLVVIILGILAAMVIPSFTGRTREARIERTKADIASISVALDLYELDNGFYPTASQGLAALKARPATPPIPGRWKGPYLKKSLPIDPWNNPYQYYSPGIHNPESFDLFSYGEDELEGGRRGERDRFNYLYNHLKHNL